MRFGTELARDVGNKVHDMRIAFDFHELTDLYAARSADAPNVVASKVNQHDVLGSLFRDHFAILRQILIALPIQLPRGRVPAMG